MDWRKEVIEFALGEDTEARAAEQKAWIAAEPGNPRPYFHLAALFRMQGKRDHALGLLLEAVRLEPAFAPAHVALAEIYAVTGDMAAARRHAMLAAGAGDPSAAQMLARYP
ncbi:MAG: hypothetical protein FJW39_22915 [Acidobacteria bacterium]|nr:hypothetical protein [Acidobacteriota bacterium]